MKKHKIRTIILVAVSVILVLAGTAFWLNPYGGTTGWDRLAGTKPVNQALTRDQAMQDLSFLSERIAGKHLSAAGGMPEAVEKQVASEIAGLPEEPAVLDVWTASSRILKQLNDAHSSAFFSSASTTRKRLDERFVVTRDGIVCTNGAHKGRKLATVGGVPVGELYNRFLSMYSYENVYWAEYSFPGYLRTAEGLGWLGVQTDGGVNAAFEGDSAGAVLPFVDPPQANDANTPDFVRYEIDPEKSLGILTLDECTVNQKYKDTVRAFFTAIKTKGVRNVAVDLRANGGGNSGVVNEFLRYLPVDEFADYGEKIRLGPLVTGGGTSKTRNNKYEDLTFGGDVYVLTSRGTFSSAMWFAVVLRDNNLCKVIGQPPGNKPSAYGDILLFQMPNSKLAFTLTYKQFTRPDASKNGDDALIPDYPAEITADGDGVMEKLYEVIR